MNCILLHRLFGDYETLIKGHSVDALVDFTGGVPERLILGDMDLVRNEDKLQDFFCKLLDASADRSLVMCSLDVSIILLTTYSHLSIYKWGDH